VEKYWDIATLEKLEKNSVTRVDDFSGDGSKLDFSNPEVHFWQEYSI
jgi:hypothetical protein